MSMHTETAFEQVIETHLLQHGYHKLANKEFDTDLAQLFHFLTAYLTSSPKI